VTAYRIWIQWLFDRVISDPSEYLLVNMDETAVQHEMNDRKGYMTRAHCGPTEVPKYSSRTSSSGTRSQLTLVAFICNRPEYQPILPQILLPKSERTTQAEMRMYTDMPSPIHILPKTSGWVNSKHMMTILTQLRRSCRQLSPDINIIVLIDGAAQHISREVLNHASRLHVILLLVPALCTWLLQPLDVYVFKTFKATLTTNQTLARMAHAEGLLPMENRLQCLSDTIMSVLVQRDWTHVFAKCGISARATTVKDTIKNYMSVDQLQETLPPARVLTCPEICLLCGRDRAGLLVRFFRPAIMKLQQRQVVLTTDENVLLATKYRQKEDSDLDSPRHTSSEERETWRNTRPPQEPRVGQSEIARHTRAREARHPRNHPPSKPLHHTQWY